MLPEDPPTVDEWKQQVRRQGGDSFVLVVLRLSGACGLGAMAEVQCRSAAGGTPSVGYGV